MINLNLYIPDLPLQKIEKFVARPKKGQKQATAWWSSCRLFNLQAKTELTSGLEVFENKVKLNRTETAPVLLSNFQFFCVFCLSKSQLRWL